MNIEDLRELCASNKIFVTIHAKKRMEERMISYLDVKQSVLAGEVIEKYLSYGIESKWLIAGRSNNGKMLHVVVARTNGKYLIVTAYEPDISLWSDDFRRRKKYEI